MIQDEAKELRLEDLIADEQVAVTVSHAGYLKRTTIRPTGSSGEAARAAKA